MNKKKIVFMGTPKFAVPVLEMLIENYGVDLVITQPDKKVGRKKVLTPPPVKVVALDNNIKVLQPEKISTDEETYNTLKELNPDIIITAAYGQLVPEKILEIPKHKCINVHGSLLPKLRGGAPIQYSILEDHKKTGITIMYMVKKLDAGDMISKVEVDISRGLPMFSIVGMGDTAILESKFRVKAALKNSDYEVRPQKIVVNLSPAGIKKEGAQFDLAIAIGIILEMKLLRDPREIVKDYLFIGELSLDGEVMSKLTCFKAYDIRSRLGEELNVDIVYRIGRAFGQFLKPKTIVVGGDVRLTSKELKSAVTNGLLDSGVNVIDLGETGTEDVYFATSF